MEVSTEEDLVLPQGPFAAYLFDLDGTIADSMPLHYRAWSQTLAEHGGAFPEDLFYSWGGITPFRTAEMLNEHFGYTLDPAKAVHHKEALYLAMLPEVQPIAAVVAHIKAQHTRIPFAVVSGSARDSIYRTLTVLGLLEYFPVIVGSEDYTHGKPHPEPFLTAAARLGVAAEDCLVFEDAEPGLASAKAAGMACVRVPVRRMNSPVESTAE